MDSCRYCKSSFSRDYNILFCPECGSSILDLEQKVQRRQMGSIKKVNLMWQTFLSVIPFMPFAAAYRIQKLRKASIYYIIAVVLPLFPVLIFNAIVDAQYSNISEQAASDPTVQARFSSFLNFYETFWNWISPYLLGACVYLVSSLVMVYFIRKWSTDWNKEIALLEYLKS